MNFKFILIFLFLQTGAGLEINLDYSTQVSIENISFNLQLIDFPSGVYDVKIDLFSEDKRISKIWDGKWKSTVYYISKIINNKEEKSFLVNVGNFTGEAKVIVKIRNDAGKIYTYENYSINILNKDYIEQEQNQKDEQIPVFEEEKPKNKEKNEIKTNIQIISKIEPITYELINLNPKTIKTQENSQNKEQKIVKYSIFGFCILLLCLYLKKSKRKKNEFTI